MYWFMLYFLRDPPNICLASVPKAKSEELTMKTRSNQAFAKLALVSMVLASMTWHAQLSAKTRDWQAGARYQITQSETGEWKIDLLTFPIDFSGDGISDLSLLGMQDTTFCTTQNASIQKQCVQFSALQSDGFTNTQFLQSDNSNPHPTKDRPKYQ